MGEGGICFGVSVMVSRQGFWGENFLFLAAVMVSEGFECAKLIKISAFLFFFGVYERKGIDSWHFKCYDLDYWLQGERG